MPLPPLVPQRPAMPTNQEPERPEEPPVTISNEKSDAEMVLAILSNLEEKLQVMDDRVEKLQIDDRKHYDSLRRGLKRLKDEKDMKVGPDGLPPMSSCEPKVVSAQRTNPMFENNPDAVSPCCICNYCLKRTISSDLTDCSRRCDLCFVQDLC